MKPIIRTFDSHEEADEFSRQQDMSLTPEDRLKLGNRISIEFWKLHHPEQSLTSVHENMRIEVRNHTVSYGG